jgi:hypothetical protein
MRGEGAGDRAIIVAVAAPVQRARLDLGRQVVFLQRQQASGVEDDVGVGYPAVRAGSRGSIGQFLTAEAREQCAASIVFGLPFGSADPAVAVTGAAVLEMKGVQHAVAEEPVRA